MDRYRGMALTHHVAIIQPGYLKRILSGEKTMECRLSRHRTPPWRCVLPGQVIYFKAVSGPYRCQAIAGQVWEEDALTPEKITRLRQQHDAAIMGDEAYWQQKRPCRYATLIELTRITRVNLGPAIPRSHGRAWFVIHPPTPSIWLMPAGGLAHPRASDIV